MQAYKYEVRVFDRKPWRKVERFSSYDLLVNHLAAANYGKFFLDGSCKSRIANHVLERAITPGGDGEHRNTLISSLETGENLYGKALMHDVTSARFDAAMEADRQAKEAVLWRKERLANKYGKDYLGFRNGPVPTTGAPRRRYFCRHVRTFPAHRDAADPEMRGFIRAKRRLVPSLWDDPIISRADAKSWKDTTRDRKQWMRGVKNGIPRKGKGVDVGPYETRKKRPMPDQTHPEYFLLDDSWVELPDY